MGASVASHVVNGVHALTTSLEFDKTVGVKVAHVAVSKVHEGFALRPGSFKHDLLAFWDDKVMDVSLFISEISDLNYLIRMTEG